MRKQNQFDPNLGRVAGEPEPVLEEKPAPKPKPTTKKVVKKD